MFHPKDVILEDSMVTFISGLYLYWYRYRYRCLYSWYRHSIGIGKLITYTLPIPITASST